MTLDRDAHTSPPGDRPPPADADDEAARTLRAVLLRHGPQPPAQAARLAGLRASVVTRLVAEGRVAQPAAVLRAHDCHVCGTHAGEDHLCRECRERLCEPLVTGIARPRRAPEAGRAGRAGRGTGMHGRSRHRPG